MITGVHVQLGHGAAADHGHVGARTAGRHACGGDDGGHGPGAEAAHVKTAGVAAFGYFGQCFGHVAAAALHGVAHGFLGAFDDEVDVRGRKPGVFDEVQQGEHAAGLTGQVFQHDAGFEVFVRIVSAAAAARQLAFRVEGQGVLFFHHVQNVRLRASFFQPGHLFFPDYGVLGQLFRNGGGEAFFQPDEVKNVADVHEPEEFVFGHDFTERAETLRRTQIVDPRRGSLFELVDAHGADIGFVGRVGLRFLIGLGVLRQCAQEFGIRFALALLSGRAAVVQGQFGGEVQAVGCGLDASCGHISSSLACRVSVADRRRRTWRPAHRLRRRSPPDGARCRARLRRRKCRARRSAGWRR